jgi:hypothetical protein
MIQNELGMQARRQGVKLTEPQYQAAERLVGRGASPAEAVREIASRVQSPSATPPVASTPEAPPSVAPPKKAPARPKLTADEADEYLRLLEKGETHQEAVRLLMDQRRLASMPGTVAPDEMRQRIARRQSRDNRTASEGRPSEPSPQNTPVPAAKPAEYKADVVHITTPKNAEAIGREGFKIGAGKGIGGDDYGPGVYLADKRSDAGAYWRSQMETMGESGRGQAASLGGSVSLRRPLIVEDIKALGGGRNGPKGAEHLVSEYLPKQKARFDELVRQGARPNAALGQVAKESGHDGIVFQRTGGDEIVAFSPSSVKFAPQNTPVQVAAPVEPVAPPVEPPAAAAPVSKEIAAIERARAATPKAREIVIGGTYRNSAGDSVSPVEVSPTSVRVSTTTRDGRKTSSVYIAKSVFDKEYKRVAGPRAPKPAAPAAPEPTPAPPATKAPAVDPKSTEFEIGDSVVLSDGRTGTVRHVEANSIQVGLVNGNRVSVEPVTAKVLQRMNPPKPAETTVTQKATKKPQTPAVAAEKVRSQVEKVVDLKGATSAADVQRRVIAALEEEVAGATQANAKYGAVEVQPSKAYGGREFSVFVNGEPVISVDRYGKAQAHYGVSDELITALGGKPVELGKTGNKSDLWYIVDRASDMTPTELHRIAKAKVSQQLSRASGAGTITVQIPGDGTFTIERNPHAIQEVIDRMKTGGSRPWRGLIANEKPLPKPKNNLPDAAFKDRPWTKWE